jgi:hypothetical protein
MTDEYDAADIASLARDLIVAGRAPSYAWTTAEEFVAERKRRQEVVREQENEAQRRHEFERRVESRAKVKLGALAKTNDIPALADKREMWAGLCAAPRVELEREAKALAEWEASK